MAKIIYLDNGATTTVDPEVFNAMKPFFSESYGNASSLHLLGERSKEALEQARNTMARSINAQPEEVFFTSGGTESNNLAIKGLAFSNKQKNHIITTKIEHKSVLNVYKWLETQGFKTTYLDVDSEGFVKAEDLEKAITKKTLLVSIIHGNNEVGTIQNLEELGKICKKHNVLFHTDACQSFTKTLLDVQKQNLDLVTLNAHKIHGPKGVGALFVRKEIKLTPWQHGGDHEKGIRSGTENIHGIVGFAKAAETGMQKKTEQMQKLRDQLIQHLFKIPGTKLNGPETNRLCNNVNITFKGIEGEAIASLLSDEGICVSTGSACSEKTLEPSYVLRAMGKTHEDANGSIRMTLSRFTTEKDIKKVIEVLPGVVERLRKMSPYGKV